MRLLVIGDFDRPTHFEAEVADLLGEGLREGWTAWLRGGTSDQVSRALHASDLAALPLHSGAASNRSSLLTTLAHHLPTVTTRGPATPDDFARLHAAAAATAAMSAAGPLLGRIVAELGLPVDASSSPEPG